jgi:putative intracellular protease/amidase
VVLRDLGQCCVAALTLDGPGHDELGNAMRLLSCAGAEVQVVSANGGADGLPVGRAEPELYDAVLLPCAVTDLERWNAGREALAFVEHFLRSGKLVLGFAAAALDGAGGEARPLPAGGG